jgi:hypothetical protein
MIAAAASAFSVADAGKRTRAMSLVSIDGGDEAVASYRAGDLIDAT